MKTMDSITSWMALLWLIQPQTGVLVIGKESVPADAHTYCQYVNRHVGLEDARGLVVFSGGTPPRQQSVGDVMPDNVTVKCPPDCSFCYSLWLTDANKVTFVKQGCWGFQDEDLGQCDLSTCVSHDRPRSRTSTHNNSQFCCCRGNRCNENVTQGQYVALAPKAMHPMAEFSYKKKTVLIAMTSVVTVSVITVLAFLLFRLYCSRRHLAAGASDAALPALVRPLDAPEFDIEKVALVAPLSHGRFGDVWRGSLGGADVAVKVYEGGASSRQHYINERDLYALPYMRHDSLLKFYGAGTRSVAADGTDGKTITATSRITPTGSETSRQTDVTAGGDGAPRGAVVTQHWLVLEYAAGGTLADYLKHNESDWQTLCRLFHSVASGVAFLHSDLSHLGKMKPTIAHRDLNTRNILMRPGLRCCIADFGFAMQLMGAPFNEREESAEQSLTDVGTLRYMAPEVLEGAVNLRDCEASLKQVDVYALALIFWEIASRCSSLYQGLPVPQYQLAFQAEVGLRPTFDEMQTVVSRNKVRPLFPDVWKDSNPAIRALKETMDDCWDHDAEARLTALCVEERVVDMANLWENRHKGVSPSVNPPPINVVDNIVAEGGAPEMHSPLLGGANGRDETSTTTVETLLSPLPAAADDGAKDNWNADFGAARNRERAALCAAGAGPVRLVAHGQNPTVARNTHRDSDERLAVRGNTLAPPSGSGDGGGGDDQPGVATDAMLAALADDLSHSLLWPAGSAGGGREGVQRKRLNVAVRGQAASGGGWLARLRRPRADAASDDDDDAPDKSNLVATRRRAQTSVPLPPVVRPTTLPLVRPPAVPQRARSHTDLGPGGATVWPGAPRRPASMLTNVARPTDV